jgi:hypothetical protein
MNAGLTMSLDAFIRAFDGIAYAEIVGEYLDMPPLPKALRKKT